MIKKAFIYFSLALKDHNLINDDAVFIDETKIEADANKYSFTWKKSVQKYHASLKGKVSALYEEQVVKAMDLETVQSASGLEVISEKVTVEITKLDKEIKQEPKVIKGGSPKKRRRRFLKKVNRQLTQDFIPRAKKYEEAEKIFRGRNSFSKTDHDATFMRMKEDPMKNRETKPGYNLQITTHNQFVLDYGLFDNPTDTRTLVLFLEQFHSTDFFDHIVADARYGSDYNYATIIDQFEKEPLIPYGTFLKEQTRKFKNDPTKPQNWAYNEADDYYIDYLEVRFSFYRYSTRKDAYGFKRDIKIYKADKVQVSAELDKLAKTPKGRQRQIHVNQTWNYYKERIKENLSSEEGQAIYRQRKYDVEPVFGHMKRDFGVRRTHLRGQKSVENDIGLLLMIMNLEKLGKMVTKLGLNNLKNRKIRL